jgi:hypothetical protein
LATIRGGSVRDVSGGGRRTTNQKTQKKKWSDDDQPAQNRGGEVPHMGQKGPNHPPNTGGNIQKRYSTTKKTDRWNAGGGVTRWTAAADNSGARTTTGGGGCRHSRARRRCGGRRRQTSGTTSGNKRTKSRRGRGRQQSCRVCRPRRVGPRNASRGAQGGKRRVTVDQAGRRRTGRSGRVRTGQTDAGGNRDDPAAAVGKR